MSQRRSATTPDDPTGGGRPSRSGKAELERTLGFGSAISLGLGTMIGAGIFVFPGIAAGEAGPAATLSFGLGAVVAIVGLGQWVGLVFASAFYLVGAGHYLAEAADIIGVNVDVPPAWIGFGTAIVLMAISLAGTRGAGRL